MNHLTDAMNYCFVTTQDEKIDESIKEAIKYWVTPKQEKKMSNVNHPKHYNTGKIEVIEFIEDQKLGYHLGNSVKYISRAGNKDPENKIEDLEKAAWYLNRKLELLRAKRHRRDVVRPNDMNPRTK